MGGIDNIGTDLPPETQQTLRELRGLPVEGRLALLEAQVERQQIAIEALTDILRRLTGRA